MNTRWDHTRASASRAMWQSVSAVYFTAKSMIQGRAVVLRWRVPTRKMFDVMSMLMVLVIPVEVHAAVIVDTLGAATPSTQFSVFGTGGCVNAIESIQFVGPEFTLAQPTVITEIGGFFVNCGFLSGVPQCPEIAQFAVQIRPSTNGVPDLSIILASYPLSKNDDVFVATYQSVAINLPLEAGTYFALFAPLQDDMAGYVVGNATDPFLYQAGIIPWGALNPSTGRSTFEGSCRNAVRILSTPISELIEVEIDIKPGSEPAPINPKSQGVIPVAILTTDTFDATTVNPATARFGAPGTEAAPVLVAVEDVNGDGQPDLLLHFNTQDTGIQCGDTSASLTGETADGQPIQGSDAIVTTGCKK
jgi:hypothetical protein